MIEDRLLSELRLRQRRKRLLRVDFRLGRAAISTILERNEQLLLRLDGVFIVEDELVLDYRRRAVFNERFHGNDWRNGSTLRLAGRDRLRIKISCRSRPNLQRRGGVALARWHGSRRGHVVRSAIRKLIATRQLI